jgi:hypothetical protein
MSVTCKASTASLNFPLFGSSKYLRERLPVNHRRISLLSRKLFFRSVLITYGRATPKLFLRYYVRLSSPSTSYMLSPQRQAMKCFEVAQISDMRVDWIYLFIG